MNLNLSQIANNFTSVNINGVRVWFSYETAIGFAFAGNIVVRQNVWGTTTGKHLNRIDGGDKTAKANRVGSDDFTEMLHLAMSSAFAPTAS